MALGSRLGNRRFSVLEMSSRPDFPGGKMAASVVLSGRVVDKAEMRLFNLPSEDNRRGRNGVA